MHYCVSIYVSVKILLPSNQRYYELSVIYLVSTDIFVVNSLSFISWNKCSFWKQWEPKPEWMREMKTHWVMGSPSCLACLFWLQHLWACLHQERYCHHCIETIRTNKPVNIVLSPHIDKSKINKMHKYVRFIYLYTISHWFKMAPAGTWHLACCMQEANNTIFNEKKLLRFQLQPFEWQQNYLIVKPSIPFQKRFWVHDDKWAQFLYSLYYNANTHSNSL